jgi:anti-sigma-K factor RskA
MSVHQQFEEDLALYALGSLQADEQASLEKHLEECSGCNAELEHLRGDMALLSLSTVGPAPPRRERERLLSAIESETKLRLIPQRSSWWTLVPWLAAAAMLLVAALLWRQNSGLLRDLVRLRSDSLEQQIQLQQAQDIVATLTATDALRVTLVAAKTPPQPQGKAIYVRGRASLVFLASNFPALPAQKAYELWLIPANGAPIPAGVFKPDAHGSATVVNPPLPAGTPAKAFAITIEPESGSTTPTMPIVMVGAGE